jgi:hypothetical protein
VAGICYRLGKPCYSMVGEVRYYLSVFSIPYLASSTATLSSTSIEHTGNIAIVARFGKCSIAWRTSPLATAMPPGNTTPRRNPGLERTSDDGGQASWRANPNTLQSVNEPRWSRCRCNGQCNPTSTSKYLELDKEMAALRAQRNGC